MKHVLLENKSLTMFNRYVSFAFPSSLYDYEISWNFQLKVQVGVLAPKHPAWAKNSMAASKTDTSHMGRKFSDAPFSSGETSIFPRI